MALIKPAVRAQTAYTLSAPPARRKLNQNESPWDVPPALKREVLAAAEAAAWHRYPDFAPPELLAALAARYGWTPDGVLVGNGSNELIQAILATTLGPGHGPVTSRTYLCASPTGACSAVNVSSAPFSCANALR